MINYLESEAIYIFREVVSEDKNPVFLYSIGKDSSVMLHLYKAFSCKPHLNFTYRYKVEIQRND